MRSVLVINQDLAARESFASVLRHAGFDVVLARTGHEGLRLVRLRAIDLVLADVRLADITRLDVLRELGQEGSTSPS